MDIRKRLQKSVQEAAVLAQGKKLAGEIKIADIRIDRPTQKSHGDYATGIALNLGSQLNKKPKTVAKRIIEEIKKDPSLAGIISRVEVAPPGFINFFLQEDFLRKQLAKIVRTEKYGSAKIGRNKKLNLEFISVNPTGELHVGHARTAFYGDVLGNILSYADYKVIREYYINNARQSAQIKELGKTALGKGTSYKGPYLDTKLKEYKKTLRVIKQPATAGYFLAGKIQKDIAVFLKKDAKVHFDIWFEEETLYQKKEVKRAVAQLDRDGLVYKKDGALWLETTRFGDNHDQVLIRSTGEYTYFASDIAYHINKAKRKFNVFIDIWGADHQGHVRRMYSALKGVGIHGVTILVAQLVRFRGGARLSKRKGNIITVKDLIEEVGLDAARFFYLTKSLDSQMEFDLDLARQQSQKNPVYYIQYTHARIRSILRKSKVKNQKLKIQVKIKNLETLKGEGEINLIRKLIQFPEIIEDTAKDYQVHRLTTYVLELAREFNQFYRDYRVIDGEGLVNQSRLVLTATTGTVLKQCLVLLGIRAPEKM